jgi:glycosyltransferase involved in cell wall biosynthesis
MIELVSHNPPNQTSGIGRYYRELFRHLKDRIDVRMAFPRFPPLSERFTILKNFPLGILDHEPGSIVHFTQIMGCAQMLWNPVHPAIATVHDLGVLVCEEDRELFNRIDMGILALQMDGLKNMDGLCVNSEYTRLSLIDKLGIPGEKITFVQLGVDKNSFRPIPGAKEIIAQKYGLVLNPDTYYLINVGSELPRKNLVTLLRAMKILCERRYSIALLKIGSAGGDKWRQRTLSQIEALGLQKKIHFLDIVPEIDLPLFYNVANLAVTSTLLEGGFAWLAMEAMACKKPVVVSDMAQIPADAQSSVSIFPARNAEALAVAIMKFIDDPDYSELMALKGHNLIRDWKYSWEATADAMLKIYQSLSD